MSRTTIATLLSAAVLSTTSANAYEPRLDRLEPQGAQRGTEITVSLLGPRLGVDPQELVLYRPGIQVNSIERVNNNHAKATLSIPPDCPLGRCELRLRTASGLSNLRTFHVGALAEVKEAEPNNDPSASQAIELGTTVNGCVTQEDIDCYRVTAAEGERLSVEIEGLRMGRTFFDPAIELLDATGQVIAACDDASAVHQDALLSINTPHSGEYVIRVRESALRGDGACIYRLHVGRFPRPTGVFPPAAARGEEATLTWIGDASGQHKTAIRAPATGESYNYWPEDEQGVAPSSLELLLTDKPPQLEAEPNDNRQQPSPLNVPGHAAGRIQSPNDIDYFAFSAKKGEVLDFRSHARRLRSPLDPLLRVYDSKGRQRNANDDDRGNPDSYLRFTAPENGEYLLRVEDRLNRGGPQHTYVVEVSKPQPRVDVAIDERRRYEATVIEVPKNGFTAAMLTVNRRDVSGKEDLLLDLEGLPEGVTAYALPLASNYNRMPVVFSAEADAELSSALCPIKCRLQENVAPLQTRLSHQTWLARGRNNRDMWSHFADRAPVAVTQPLPFRLRVEESSAPLVQGGVKELKVIADRDDGFDESIRVYTLYNPPGVSSNRSRSIVKGKNEAIIPATAAGNARPGDWPMTIVGELNAGGRVYACTPFTTLTVVEPYFDMTTPNLDLTQGETRELTIELNQRRDFDGQAELSLVRLPPGVTVQPAKINQEATSVVFRLTVAPDAKPGRHRGMGCQARLTLAGQPVVYTQGYSEVRVDPRSQQPVATARKPSSEDQT